MCVCVGGGGIGDITINELIHLQVTDECLMMT